LKTAFCWKGFLRGLYILLISTSPAWAGAITVPAGGDLQGALNAAQPGDVILVQAGAVFTGPFTLPLKSGNTYITIRTSASDAQLPPAGQRISPSYANVMPKLVASSNQVLVAARSAHHYQFVGIEISPAAGAYLENTIILGDGSETAISQLPHDIIFDRCYIHGDPNVGTRRGIAMNGVSVTISNSYLSDFKSTSEDAEAIMCWNGPGPFQITNNFIEAAAENILFGGWDPAIPNLVPSDITITHNYFFKPLSWRVGDPSYAGTHWIVKNLLELKNAQRVTISGNILQNNWADAQNGFAILFTVRDQNGTAPWSVVQNVTFTNNILEHVGAGFNILGFDNNAPSQQTNHINIVNNLLLDVSTSWGGNGRLYQILDESANVVIDHNTAFNNGSLIWAQDIATAGGVMPNFVYRNSIGANNIDGNGTGSGNNTVSTYFPGAVIARNAFIGDNPSLYPGNNFFPATYDQVGFVNLAGGDYHLSSSSPYKGAATDGTDVGANVDAVNAATAGVVSGTTGGTPPPSSTGPVISNVAAASITATGATITWTTDQASDSQVNYGQTSAYGSSTPRDATMVTSHSQTITGLAAGTLYHYQVQSRNASGLVSTSGDFTFTTLSAAPGGGSGGSTITRFEQNDPAVTYAGLWYPNTDPSDSGGSAVLSMTSGSVAVFKFTGTAVSWIGRKDPWAGVAQVYLDGVSQGMVDTSGPCCQSQAVVFSKSGLASTSHTLVIQVMGWNGASSTAPWIWVDAFNVTTGSSSNTTGSSSGGSGSTATGAPVKFEQNDPAVAYAGLWYPNTDPSDSGGSAVLSMTSGSVAVFKFTGTAVSWIGRKDPWAGVAQVYLDGVSQGMVDTSGPCCQSQAVVFSKSGLASTSHTLVIQVMGWNGASSTAPWIWVDAFAVTP
jgi:hypothetical protein